MEEWEKDPTRKVYHANGAPLVGRIEDCPYGWVKLHMHELFIEDEIIKPLEYYPMIDRYGNCHGQQPPTISEITDKINEIIEKLNNLK